MEIKCSYLAILALALSRAYCKLYQLNSNEILCPHDDAAFICIVEYATIINWRLITTSASSTVTLIPSEEGMFEHTSLGSSPVRAIFVDNGTHIFSNLNITVLNLQKLIIACQNEKINVTFMDYANLAPTELTLTPLGSDVFSVTWEAVPADILNYYTIAMNLPPLHRMISITTSDSSAILRLSNTTHCNVSLTTNICLGLDITSNFSVRNCPFLAEFLVLNVQYIIGLNHSQKALLTYADGRKLSLECGLDEEWIVNSTDNLLSNKSEINGKDCVMTDTSISDHTTLDDGSTAVPMNTQQLWENHNLPRSITLTASISGIGLCLIILIGIIGFVLGMSCGARLVKKKQNVQLEIPNPHYGIGPVYEEVQQTKEPVKIETSCNVAYEHVQEFSKNAAYQEVMTKP